MVINTTQDIVTKQTKPPPHHCTISSILNNRFTDGLMHCVLSLMPVCDSTSLSRTHESSVRAIVVCFLFWADRSETKPTQPSSAAPQGSTYRVQMVYLTYLCQSLCYQQAFVDYSHSENCPCYFVFLQTPKMTAHEKSQYISSLQNTQTRLSGLLTTTPRSKSLKSTFHSNLIVFGHSTLCWLFLKNNVFFSMCKFLWL